MATKPTMKVPLLDLRPQLDPLRDKIAAAVLEVIDSTTYIMGPKLEELERAMATYLGCEHAVGVSSGTDALLLALMGLDIGPGDRVITTPFSFFATAGVISRLGAMPLFVDIDPESFNLEPAKLREYLDSLSAADLGRVKAIIPVHLYGQCADMEPLLEVAGSFGIPLVEDAAQAIGAEYPGANGPRRAGSMGKVGCFSFFPSKNLGAVGDAGLITTNDDELERILRIKRVHGGHPKYFHQVIGGNFRLDPIQAAVLLVKLPTLEKWHRQRQENAEFYASKFEKRNIKQIQPPKALYKGSGAANYHIFNQYVIRASMRDQLKEFLGGQGIGTEIYYPVPFHRQECFAYLGHKEGDFPESEKAAAETLALPIYPGITREMQSYVVEKVGEFYDGATG